MKSRFFFGNGNSLSGLEHYVNLESVRAKLLRQPGQEDIAAFRYWLLALDFGQNQMVHRAGIMLNWLIGYYGARGFDTTKFYEMRDSKLKQAQIE